MDVGLWKSRGAKFTGQVVGHGGHLAQAYRGLEGDDALEDLTRFELIWTQIRRRPLRITGQTDQRCGEAAGKYLHHGLLLTLWLGSGQDRLRKSEDVALEHLVHLCDRLMPTRENNGLVRKQRPGKTQGPGVRGAPWRAAHRAFPALRQGRPQQGRRERLALGGEWLHHFSERP